MLGLLLLAFFFSMVLPVVKDVGLRRLVSRRLAHRLEEADRWRCR